MKCKPYLRDYLYLYRNEDYVKFSKTTPFTILKFLMSNKIVDQSNLTRINQDICDEYFVKKKLLVTNYNQENIAKYICSSLITVSRGVKYLKENDMVKVIKIMNKQSKHKSNLYELGYYTGVFGTPDYEEHYYFEEYFNRDKTIKTKPVKKENIMSEKERVDARKHNEIMQNINKIAGIMSPETKTYNSSEMNTIKSIKAYRKKQEEAKLLRGKKTTIEEDEKAYEEWLANGGEE